jgi:hypothetical protein
MGLVTPVIYLKHTLRLQDGKPNTTAMSTTRHMDRFLICAFGSFDIRIECKSVPYLLPPSTLCHALFSDVYNLTSMCNLSVCLSVSLQLPPLLMFETLSMYLSISIFRTNSPSSQDHLGVVGEQLGECSGMRSKH